MDRKVLLAKLISDRFNGSQADFARAINKSPSQVNQWITGIRTFGDASARHTEITLNLGQGYFDGTGPMRGTLPAPVPALPPDEAALLASYRALTAKDRARALIDLEYKAKVAALEADPPEPKQEAA